VRPTTVWVAEFLPLSSFVMVMFQDWLRACLCVLNPYDPATSTCVCSEV